MNERTVDFSERMRPPRQAETSQAAAVPALLPSLADLFSIEMCFVLFVFAGRYKQLPELRGFPVDFTVLFFAATCWLSLLALITRKMRPPPLDLRVLAIAAFCTLAAVSLFWSSMDALNTDKAVRFLLFTSPSFFFGLMLAQSDERRARLVRLILWFSCALLFYYAYYRYVRGVDLADEESSEYSNNYLEYGSHAQLLFVAFLSVATLGGSKQMFGAVAGATFALFALLSIGGRGPFVLALLAVPLLMFGLVLRRGPSLPRVTRLALLVSAWILAGALGYMATGGVEDSGDSVHLITLQRFDLELSGENTTSMDERLEGRRHAFQRWLEKPLLGWGLGEFRVQDSYLEYPHNLLLEILMEVGLIGAFLFFSSCALAIVDCIRATLTSALSWVEATIILIFLPELALHLTLQGYLGDDRAFFAYIGLAMAVGKAALWQPLPASRRGRSSVGYSVPAAR
jgi:O-antigen ligase